jgi:hypothetical protein
MAPLYEREAVRALWRERFEAWRLSGLAQREYCERHGLLSFEELRKLASPIEA